MMRSMGLEDVPGRRIEHQIDQHRSGPCRHRRRSSGSTGRRRPRRRSRGHRGSKHVDVRRMGDPVDDPARRRIREGADELLAEMAPEQVAVDIVDALPDDRPDPRVEDLGPIAEELAGLVDPGGSLNARSQTMPPPRRSHTGLNSAGGGGLSVFGSTGSPAVTARPATSVSAIGHAGPIGRCECAMRACPSPSGSAGAGRHDRPIHEGEGDRANRSESARPRVPCGPMSETLAPASAPVVGAPSDPESLIHARGLTKRFGEFTAVDAIDFDVAPGESFGFLGPNGAGKTSTMRMIGCVSPMSAGTLRVLGHGPDRRRPAHPRPARGRAPAGHARHRADGAREPDSSTAGISACRAPSARGAPTSCSTSPS